MPDIMTEISLWQQSEANETLIACGIREGMRVLDFGCGALYWALPAANAVGASGKLYAMDQCKGVIWETKKTIEREKIANIIPVCCKSKKISSFKEMADVILYYDMFHCLAWNRDTVIKANAALIKEFYRILPAGGVLSVAVFGEICSVQDPVNGPFTPTGNPKWFKIPYEKALEHYKVFDIIYSCGFELASTVPNAAVHFDEIEKHIHKSKYKDFSFSDFERRDIWNFRKM